jgi:hypothetical protein
MTDQDDVQAVVRRINAILNGGSIASLSSGELQHIRDTIEAQAARADT